MFLNIQLRPCWENKDYKGTHPKFRCRLKLFMQPQPVFQLKCLSCFLLPNLCAVEYTENCSCEDVSGLHRSGNLSWRPWHCLCPSLFHSFSCHDACEGACPALLKSVVVCEIQLLQYKMHRWPWSSGVYPWMQQKTQLRKSSPLLNFRSFPNKQSYSTVSKIFE